MAAATIFFIICAATYVVNSVDRSIYPILVRSINQTYGFSLSQGGFLSTIFTLGLGLGGIATGYLVDRMSRKSSMIAGIVVYSVFTLLTSVAFGFFDLAFYRTMTGVGEAMQNIALNAAVGAYFPGARTLVIGLVQCAFGAGSYAGPQIGAWLLATGGSWKVPFYVMGIVGLIGAIATLLFVSKGFTEQQAGKSKSEASDQSYMPATIWNLNVGAVALAGIFRSFAFYGYVGLYPTFLITQLHFSIGTAAAISSLFGLGQFMAPLAGYIADRVNQKTFQIVSLIVLAVTGYLIFNVAQTELAHSILSFIEGAAGSGFVYINGYSLAQRSAQSHAVGRVSGVYYASTTLPASVSGFVFGLLVEHFGWGNGALLQMSILLIIPIIGSLFFDTRRITGPGRRTTQGRRIWT
jgi:MFS family permease